MADKQQPKIVQRQLLRAAILLFTLAGLFLGYQWLSTQGKDLGGLRTVNSAGMIAAIEFRPEGQQAVIFTADGKEIREPKFTAGDTDRDIAWHPTGNSLFFVSDRKDKTYHIFRWNPGFEAEQRTHPGTRSRNNPAFAAEMTAVNREEPLITSGGKVLALNPTTGETRQMLPPIGREVPTQGGSDGESGTGGQFDGVYSNIGNSFKYARWCGGQKFIAAVMGRDDGEVLVLQNMFPTDERDRLPMPIIAGEKVDFDVSPADGTLVFVVQNLQPTGAQPPQEWIKNGKVVKPFEHLLGRLDPVKMETGPIATSPTHKSAFGSPRISPDGSSVLVVIGEYEVGGSLNSKALFAMPNQNAGAGAAARLVEGEVFEPSWSPDGSRIAYAKRENGKRSIFTAGRDGSGARNISGTSGNFGSPLFSPQVKE